MQWKSRKKERKKNKKKEDVHAEWEAIAVGYRIRFLEMRQRDTAHGIVSVGKRWTPKERNFPNNAVISRGTGKTLDFSTRWFSDINLVGEGTCARTFFSPKRNERSLKGNVGVVSYQEVFNLSWILFSSPVSFGRVRFSRGEKSPQPNTNRRKKGEIFSLSLSTSSISSEFLLLLISPVVLLLHYQISASK